MQVAISHLVFWHWFALALLLVIFDVALGANFLFMWCGLAATLVGILLLIFPGMSWGFQFLVFGFGVMASLMLWQMLKKYSRKSAQPNLNRRALQYVGRVFTVETPIENGRGKIRVEDTLWTAQGADTPAGVKVRVVGVDGVILKVEQVKD